MQVEPQLYWSLFRWPMCRGGRGNIPVWLCSLAPLGISCQQLWPSVLGCMGALDILPTFIVSHRWMQRIRLLTRHTYSSHFPINFPKSAFRVLSPSIRLVNQFPQEPPSSKAPDMVSPGLSFTSLITSEIITLRIETETFLWSWGNYSLFSNPGHSWSLVHLLFWRWQNNSLHCGRMMRKLSKVLVWQGVLSVLFTSVCLVLG